MRGLGDLTPVNPITPDSLLHALNWRYATKKFDPAKKIPTAAWHALEQALAFDVVPERLR